MPLLDPTKKHPMTMPDGTVIKQVVHLAQVIDHPRIEVGEFSYLSNFGITDAWTPADYAAALAPYIYPLSLEKLVIGRFVQIANGVRIITSSANHAMCGFSTYPFANFMMTPKTSREDIQAMFAQFDNKGDTIIGNDVWIGMDAKIMPGLTVGDGAVISAGAVVVKDVPPYTVVGGNPAKPLRRRFSDEVIEVLRDIRWWDWPTEVIEANLDAIRGCDIEALRRAAPGREES